MIYVDATRASYRAGGSVDPVDVKGVVDVEVPLGHAHAEVGHQPAHHADEHRRLDVDEARRRRDSGQSRQDAVVDACGGGAVVVHAEPQPDHRRRTGADVRADHGGDGDGARGEGGAAVEAEPAHPQQRHARGGEGQVGGRELAFVGEEVLALAHVHGRDKRAHARRGVDDDAAREIKEANPLQEATTPDPVN
eukprot:CAMPEP_0113715274 /NCGR_PEP_ID=MMETSP0038_2-20120614/33170_1 /TAXON_ID=2898 /ORGANISM="Cryptomonas paramecium" /LENGTH=192 /DNA_ID=CAMNT_0000642521 /DNA_START=50 /DNA_END=628 /DNA_ORIENTATION=+ /assembly_acc=CAM_ASM_000170